MSYQTGHTVSAPLLEFDLDVAAGEAVALIGPSGSGKSTLLRVLCGLQKADSGSITLDGTPVLSAAGTADPRFALVHQDYQLVDFLNVGDNLRLALEVRRLPRDDDRVEQALASVDLTGKIRRMPEELSGGERQRVALARALVLNATVVLADEPTGALDRQNAEAVAALLHNLATKDGVHVIVATHDQRVSAVMDRRIVLEDGRAVIAEAAA